MRNIFNILLLLVSVFLFSTVIFEGCADLSSNPAENNNESNSNLKVQITTPVNGSKFTEGNNEIIYSVASPYSLKFMELYINGVFKRNYPPNSDGSAPQIFYNFDSTYTGKNISLYLIYYDNNNTSEKSNVVSNISIEAYNPPPFKPYDIRILKFDNQYINIGWKDSSKNIEKYELWKKINLDGEYSLFESVPGNTNNINDYNLDTNQIYFYKVRGIKNSGVSEFSNEVNTAGIITSGNLYPPTDLTAVVTSSQKVQLNWKDNSDNENYFVVQRSIDNIKYSDVAALSQNTTSYLDNSPLSVGANYYYRIKAYSNTDSAFSNVVMIKISSYLLLPPSNLTATYDKSIGVIELRWNKSDNYALYFDIERKINDNSFQLLKRVDANSTLYLDFNVSAQQTYKYRIRSYDLNQYSDYSNEVTISTF